MWVMGSVGEGRRCEEQGGQLGCPVVTRVPELRRSSNVSGMELLDRPHSTLVKPLQIYT